MDSDSGTLTWEDVEAVCKLMGVDIQETKAFSSTVPTYLIFYSTGLPIYSHDPKDAMNTVLQISKQPEVTWKVSKTPT